MTYLQPPTKTFLFKYFASPEDPFRFDYNPRLVRRESNSIIKSREFGEANVVLTPADNDPWSEVQVEQVLGGLYLQSDMYPAPAKVVAEVDPEEFLPYAFAKYDEFIF